MKGYRARSRTPHRPRPGAEARSAPRGTSARHRGRGARVRGRARREPPGRARAVSGRVGARLAPSAPRLGPRSTVPRARAAPGAPAHAPRSWSRARSLSRARGPRGRGGSGGRSRGDWSIGSEIGGRAFASMLSLRLVGSGLTHRDSGVRGDGPAVPQETQESGDRRGVSTDPRVTKVQTGSATGIFEREISSDWEDTAALVMRTRSMIFGTPWAVAFWVLSLAGAASIAVYLTAHLVH